MDTITMIFHGQARERKNQRVCPTEMNTPANFIKIAFKL